MTLDVGIAGAGYIATSRHIPTYRANDATEVVAVYDTETETMDRVAREYDVETVSSYSELCDVSDVVSICTPPHEHHDQTIEALESGCHVLTEKPMAMSVSEAENMVTTAEETGQTFSVVHNFLFMRSIRKARSLVADGTLGDINRVSAISAITEEQGKRYLKHVDGDGSELHRLKFWDESPHNLYLTEEFVGEMELQNAYVAGSNTTAQPYGRLHANFEGESGATGNVTMIWDSPISEWWILVSGSDGLVLVDIYRDILIHIDREQDHSAFRTIWVLFSGVGQASVETLRAGFRFARDKIVSGYDIPDSGFSHQVDELVNAIETGTDPPIRGPEGAAIVQRMQTVLDSTQISNDQ